MVGEGVQGRCEGPQNRHAKAGTKAPSVSFHPAFIPGLSYFSGLSLRDG